MNPDLIRIWILFIYFWSKIVIYWPVCSSYRRSLRSSKENIQHVKKWHLHILFFLLLLVICALLDPDTDPGNPMESGPTTLELLYIFCIQARNISAQFEERHEAKTVGEMKLFVERLPQMQVSCRIVNFLCSFLSSMLAKDFTFTRLCMCSKWMNEWMNERTFYLIFYTGSHRVCT